MHGHRVSDMPMCFHRASSAAVRTERARAGAGVAQKVLLAQAQALLTALKALQARHQPHVVGIIRGAWHTAIRT